MSHQLLPVPGRGTESPRRDRSRYANALAALLVMLPTLLAACLGPRTDPSRYFLITAAAAGSGPSGQALPGVLGVGPVSLPAYLERAEVATRLSETELAYSETERWAEPLRDAVARALRENLDHLLAPEAVVDHPWYDDEGVGYGVTVDFARFEADASGAVVLDAKWRITEGPDRAPLRSGASVVREPAQGGAGGAAAALSRALATLSGEIASALRGAGSGVGQGGATGR